MITPQMVAFIQAMALRWMTDTCTIERQEDSVGSLGQPLDTWQIVSTGTACRLITSKGATQLSKPDFRADWLQVSNAEARKGYETMLAEKKKEYGIGGLSSSVTYTYRVDSDMEDPN